MKKNRRKKREAVKQKLFFRLTWDLDRKQWKFEYNTSINWLDHDQLVSLRDYLNDLIYSYNESSHQQISIEGP